jgi:hypothetical protein
LSAPANIGLVRDDNQKEVRSLKPRTPVRNILVNVELLDVTWGMWHSVPDQDSIDYPVAIEKNCGSR